VKKLEAYEVKLWVAEGDKWEGHIVVPSFDAAVRWAKKKAKEHGAKQGKDLGRKRPIRCDVLSVSFLNTIEN